jgi:uncharacterized protein (TIGR01244 family)
MRLSRLELTVAALAILLPAAIGAQQKKPVVELGIDRAGVPALVEDFEGVAGGVFQDGRIYIAGQPDEDALRRFQELGITAVVNLRTPQEMDNRDRVPFDEAAFVSSLDMEYVHIPLGGDDYPYTPEAVAAFAAVLDHHAGPVLLHCTVAWRASHLWAAYLIRYHDFPLALALDRGEAIAISPPPLQGLLDRPLTLSYDE